MLVSPEPAMPIPSRTWPVARWVSGPPPMMLCGVVKTLAKLAGSIASTLHVPELAP